MKRVFIIHGWGGGPNGAWIPILKKELEEKRFSVITPQMPNTETPKIDEWINYLASLVGESDKDTFFVGHSIGCQAIIRYLESLENKKVGGVVFVAGWFDLIGLETEEEKVIARPWIENPIDFEKVKKTTDKFLAILSNNDPFVELEKNKKIFVKKLNAEIIEKSGAGHFDGNESIDLFTEIVKFME